MIIIFAFQALVCAGNGSLEVAVNLALDFDQVSSEESETSCSESDEPIKSIVASVNIGEPKKSATNKVFRILFCSWDFLPNYKKLL